MEKFQEASGITVDPVGGFLDAPNDVLEMFTRAVEVGYVTALRRLRNGHLDDEQPGLDRKAIAAVFKQRDSRG